MTVGEMLKMLRPLPSDMVIGIAVEDVIMDIDMSKSGVGNLTLNGCNYSTFILSAACEKSKTEKDG
jgi:hypothetical protein